jgi:lipoprotein-anchoring transpeptidase ErfK/SrfK
MLWHEFNLLVAAKLQGNSALADQRAVIYVDTSAQKLHVIDFEEEQSKIYPVSTAANGVGNLTGSYKTPVGIHRVRQKIGGGEVSGRVFVGREPGGLVSAQTNNQSDDEITSRILWLDGMEAGFNKGGDVDTFERYIYIHGTSDEKRIGQPVSHGCIRMTNKDVIELFDEILVNDLVLIQ